MTRYWFQDFEVRAETGELLKHGYSVKIQPQPFQILCILLERPGELVMRQELARILWNGNTWTDTEHGLNMAVKKLRDALGDSAEDPKLIETLARRGYRFIGSLQSRVEEEICIAPDVPAGSPAPPPDPRPPWRRKRVVGTAACLALLLGVAGWRVSANREEAMAFSERDAVLVARFANETGEKDLDGVVEPVLEAALYSSQYVIVASPERVADALRLMRRTEKGRIPAVLAMEVCRRDPGIRAVLAGSIRKVGARYMLAGEILLPTAREPAAMISENAADKSQILPALSRLARQVRVRLGEELSSKISPVESLEKVTTGSFEALKIYTEANALGGGGLWDSAEVLLRQALEIDPDFASANLLLAWAIRNQPGRLPVEYLPYADRAVALAGTTSEREALFIRASRHHLDGDYEQAIPVYELLLRRYADHIWAYNNLYFMYSARGQNWEVEQLLDSQMRLRPNDPWLRFRAAWLCFCLPDRTVEKGLADAGHGFALAQEAGDAGDAIIAARNMTHFMALASWVRGDVEKARNELEQWPEVGPGGANNSQSRDFSLLVTGYLALGRLQQADAVIARISDPGVRSYWGVWRALLAGDMGPAERRAQALASAIPSEETAFALMSGGRTDDAARMISRLNTTKRGDKNKILALGVLAYRQGRFDQAIDVLTPALDRIESSNFVMRLLGAQALAGSLVEKGQRKAAIELLERATGHRGCGGLGPAVFWPLLRYDLMQLYREENRLSDAEAIRLDLELQLAVADEEYELKRKLARRGEQHRRNGVPNVFSGALSPGKRTN